MHVIMMGNGWNWKRFTKFYLHIVFKSRRFVGTWHCNLYHLKYFQVSMGHYLRLNRVSQSIITSEIWPVCERYQNKSIHTLRGCTMVWSMQHQRSNWPLGNSSLIALWTMTDIYSIYTAVTYVQHLEEPPKIKQL